METVKSIERFRGRRILITGASGFIGSHLCSRLHRSGAEVHAISRRRHAPGERDYRWWQGDLADALTARDLIQSVRPEVILHLGACVDGARDLVMVAPTFRSNLAATVNLLTAATEVNCQRIILTGSLEEPAPGNAEAPPCSPYAAAKWAGNAYARMFHVLYQLPVVILRLFMVYGPAQRDLRKLIPYVILSLLQGKAPELTSGQRLVDWIYVDDVVEAFLAAAFSAGAEGQTIDVGSGELVKIRAVVELIAGQIDSRIEPRFGALPDRPFEQVRAAHCAAAHGLLGWRPAISLAEGLKRTIDWYRQGLREDAFEPPPPPPAILENASN